MDDAIRCMHMDTDEAWRSVYEDVNALVSKLSQSVFVLLPTHQSNCCSWCYCMKVWDFM